MGFGDLEMVRATLTDKPKPVIQGEGEHRHLAITSPITSNQRVLGVVLASLAPEVGQAIMNRTPFEHGYMELKQEQISLGSLGDSSFRNNAPEIIALKYGRWQLNVWSDTDSVSGRKLLLLALVSSFALLSGLMFFFAFRKLSLLLRQDQSSVLKAAKEIMQGKNIGNYPVQLDEMLPMVTSLAQFKRILDQELSPRDNSATKDRDFFDESFDIDFVEESSLPASLFQTTSTEATPISLPVYNDLNNNDQPSPAPLPNDTILAPSFESTAELSPPEPAEFEIPDSWDLDSDLFTNPSATLTKDVTRPSIENQSKVTPTIFREGLIRGLVGDTLNTETMNRLGSALASEARQFSIKNIVVARDSRSSSSALADALINGITETGCDVLDIGQVTTSALFFVAHHTEGRTGVMVTGGCSADDYNGIKWLMNDEMPTLHSMQALQRRFENNEFFRTGSASVEHNTLFSNEYIGSIADEIHIARPMTIVLDCAGGSAAHIGPSLLKTIGCDVIELKTHAPHISNQTFSPASFDELIESVKSHNADLGIYLPGDGCRVILVDSSGNVIWPDRQMMVFARDVLISRSGGQILHDTGCSKHLPEQIKKRGGRPLLCKSNPAIIRTTLKQTGAALAGTFSGHLFFNDRWLGFDDGLYAAARMIEILSADQRNSAAVFGDLPDSINTPALQIALPDHEAERLIEQLISQAQFNGHIDTSEGMKVELPNAWGLIRCSTSESGLIMRFEADTPDALQRIQAQFRNELLKIKPDISLPF
jgi:phosphomannomutase/phosphoglucomutase